MSENTDCTFCCNLMAKVYLSCRIFIMKLNVYIQHKLHINTVFPFPTFLLQYFNLQHTIYKPHYMVFMLISIKYYSDPAYFYSVQYLFPRGPIDINGEGLGMRISIQFSVPWGYSSDPRSHNAFKGYKNNISQQA